MNVCARVYCLMKEHLFRSIKFVGKYDNEKLKF